MEKLKSFGKRVFGLSIGLACDLSLIHNHFREDNWNVYCGRYIKAFTWASWFFTAMMFIVFVTFSMAEDDRKFRKKHNETLLKFSKGSKTGLFSEIWACLNSIPMIVFTLIFVGNWSLGIAWALHEIFRRMNKKCANQYEQVAIQDAVKA